MTVNRILAAKVAAYFDGWPIEEFAEKTRKNAIFKPVSGVAYYVMKPGSNEIPLEELTNLKLTPALVLVFPINLLDFDTLLKIKLIESGRRIPAKSKKTSFQIYVVGEIARNQKTDERQYSQISYDSLDALNSELPRKIDFDAEPISSEINIGYLKKILILKVRAIGQYAKVCATLIS